MTCWRSADRRTISARRSSRGSSNGQVQALLAGLKGNRLEAPYVLALTTGARQGEVLALRWGTSSQWYLEAPKTERSPRRVELERVTVDTLRSHRRRQLEERSAMGEDWQDHGFLFTDAIGRPLRGPQLLDRHFLPLLARLDLPRVRRHDLRHTAVSLALEAGVPINVISQMVGHSTTSMTMDVYAHILPGQERAASRALEAALFGGLGSAHESNGAETGTADG
jgi:integrase